MSISKNLYRFNPIYGQKIPFRIRTAENTAGSPHLRKRWREVRIHGDGTGQLRVFIDGAIVTFANGNTYFIFDCTDTPSLPRRVLLPPGSWGYSLAYEIVGAMGTVRTVELGFDMMPGEA